MKTKLCLLILTIGVAACDGPNEEKVYDGTDSIQTEEEVVLHKESSDWLEYEGVIPCADCEGINLELKLENNPDKVEKSFELIETYLGTKEGDRSYQQTGLIEVTYGIEGEPNVFVINLLDEELNVTHRFIQENDGSLHLLNQEGKRIKSEHNYRLIKK